MSPGESTRVLAWLCCDPMPPIPLGHTPVLTIGRDDACYLTLPHKQISRHHAVIKVRRGTLHLTDDGSSNGTFVNGRRVATAPLQVGDEISIGPYEMLIRSNQQMIEQGQRDVHSTTNVMRRVRRQESMVGRLEEVTVPELLHQLEFNHKTGELVLTTPSGNGRLVVKDGEPLTAEFEGETGEEAVIAMLVLKQGRFTLVGELPKGAGERRIDRSLSAVLFEASRRQDEAQSAAYAYSDADPAAQTAFPDDDELEQGLGDGFTNTREWEQFWEG
jgi:pSer/pThr/pTyr-binding forkhead associated (FHA) protein